MATVIRDYFKAMIALVAAAAVTAITISIVLGILKLDVVALLVG